MSTKTSRSRGTLRKTTETPKPVSTTDNEKPARPNYRKNFTDRISAIYTGLRTDPKDLYEPVTPALRGFQLKAAILITDPLARELFSFSRELTQAAWSLPSPRKLHELKEYQKTTSLLELQAMMVEKLFSQHILGTYPQLLERGDNEIVICAGWYAIASRYLEGDPWSELLAEFNEKHP